MRLQFPFFLSFFLQIGLKKLTEISRGSVRIEKNPALCYTTTLNWDLIVSAGENVIKDNGEEASCPGNFFFFFPSLPFERIEAFPFFLFFLA